MKQNQETEAERERLREDYKSEFGEPFRNFYCPILLVDEDTELCMGHVINEAIPQSCRAKVAQRKDVDNLFGSLVEGDFCVFLNAKRPSVTDVIADPNLSRILPVNVVCDDKVVQHYHPHNGHAYALDTILSINDGEDRFVDIALKMSKEEIENAGNLHFEMSRSFVPEATATFLKAGHLTMFKTFGYHYINSAAGLDNAGILGRFHKEAVSRSKRTRKQFVTEHFPQYSGMVIPLRGYNADLFKGSVEDNRFLVCKGSSGRFFALGILIRTNEHMAVVLVAPDTAESMDTYLNFVKRFEKAEFRFHIADYISDDSERGPHWKGYEQEFIFKP